MSNDARKWLKFIILDSISVNEDLVVKSTLENSWKHKEILNDYRMGRVGPIGKRDHFPQKSIFTTLGNRIP